MAVLDHSVSIEPSFFARVGSAIATAFENYTLARSRSAEFEYYESLSDSELAAKGLKRDEIALHVFRDHYL
ncbi:DUF1127 domain-containing protein [Planktotalea sp.]|uniref:DUF1127 domain-containing protein n=1 Tax=Planktotalea sp. TaxID=2029877 RepID=UPI00329957F8